jgi:hypothetical protein
MGGTLYLDLRKAKRAGKSWCKLTYTWVRPIRFVPKKNEKGTNQFLRFGVRHKLRARK